MASSRSQSHSSCSSSGSRPTPLTTCCAPSWTSGRRTSRTSRVSSRSASSGLQHSAITGALRTADATLYRLNLLVLLFVGFLPFPTKLVAEFVHERDAERVAGVFYGLTLMALSLAVTAFVRYAAEHRRLVRDEVEAHEVQAALAHQPSFLL